MRAAAVPGYWRNETSGVLRPAVEKYLAGGELDDDELAAMRAYLRQWIAGFFGPGTDRLRADVDRIASTADLRAWLGYALHLGVAPL